MFSLTVRSIVFCEYHIADERLYVVALGKRLVQEGHRVTIASHEEVSCDLL